MRPRAFRVAQSIRVEPLAPFASGLATFLLFVAPQPVCLGAAVSRILNLSPSSGQQADSESSKQSPDSLARALATALSQGQDKRAREILGEILKQPQLDPDFLLAVGGQFAQHDRYAEAALAFSRCLADHPAVFEAHYNLALAEFAEGKLAEALAALEAAPHSSAAQELALLYLRGKVEYGLGKKTEAERDLTAAFSRAPQQESYALDLGLYYLQQHAYDRAARVLERGATLNPQSPFLHLGLSLAQFLGGRKAQSLESAEKLLKVQPDFSPAFLLAAFVLDVNGRLKDAEKLAAQGLARPRPTAYLYYLHAAILVKLESKDYDRILKELALAGRDIPDCCLCSLTASKVHKAQGNFPAATADLERAVRFAPDYADAWYRLASLYDRVGRKADAAQARIRFERLKADKEDRETNMLRKGFLQTLSGEGQSAGSQ
ncbi:MAG: hypothetical protein DMG26_09855 [Acidobacteria bacterium]|nr:MAG: hypothetical protein DMG26_09855 [Acidobacteriota bacterium]